MNQNTRQGGHIIDLLFMLALLCVFAASSLLVVMIGANVYKNTVEGMERNYDVRTSLSYISEKIRQNDVAGGVTTAELDGCSALVLEQEFGGSAYQTWIYSDGGTLKELLVKKGAATREAGRAIMEIGAFEPELREGGIHLAVVSPSGERAELTQALRSASGTKEAAQAELGQDGSPADGKPQSEGQTDEGLVTIIEG